MLSERFLSESFKSFEIGNHKETDEITLETFLINIDINTLHKHVFSLSLQCI